MAVTDKGHDSGMVDARPAPMIGKRKRSSENEEDPRSRDVAQVEPFTDRQIATHELCSNVLEILHPYVLIDSSNLSY